MTTSEYPNPSVTSGDAGCYIDGHHGQYAIAMMVELAQNFGWNDPEVTAIAHKHLASMAPSDAPSITDTEAEILFDGADDAEQWMNDNIAPEGFSFGWDGGEFFLWSEADWQENSY